MEQINKYQNGKIYKIVSNVTDDVYIGSTCSTLSARLAQHRKNYKQYLNGKYHYVTSFKILETNDYDIVLVEDYACERKDQLYARERLCIEGCEHSVNKVIPTRTKQEYDKIYTQVNQVRISAQRKEYRQQNKDIVLERGNDYRKRNHEVLLEKSKDYYEQNKERILEQRKIKYVCQCGNESTIGNKLRHERSKKHQAFIQQQEQI